MESVNETIGRMKADFEKALMGAEIIPEAAGEVGRPCFTFYWSYYDSIRNLPDALQLVLYRAIILYSLEFTEPDFSAYGDRGTLMAVWAGLLPSLRRNLTKYLAGLKGGAPAGNQNGPNGRKGTKNQPRTNQEPTKNQPTTKQIRNKKEGIRNKKDEKKEDISLVLPFSSKEFSDAWDELCRQPKWRNKSNSALQKTLNKLGKYEERFALKLIEDAIEGEWQGVVFDDTPAKYAEWQKAAQEWQRITRQPNDDGGGWDAVNLNSEAL